MTRGTAGGTDVSARHVVPVRLLVGVVMKMVGTFTEDSFKVAVPL